MSNDRPELLHDTPEFLQSWMAGETMREKELLEMLHLAGTTDSFSHEIEEFSPEFVLGTRLDKLD